MKKQREVNIINSIIGIVLGMPFFLIVANFLPIMTSVLLVLIFSIFKFVETKGLGNVEPKRRTISIIWFILTVYLLYILYIDGFLTLEPLAGVLAAFICTLVGIIPLLTSKIRFLNILYPSTLWGIVILFIYHLDLASNSFLDYGMSMMLMIFPYGIVLINLIYEGIIPLLGVKNIKKVV